MLGAIDAPASIGAQASDESVRALAAAERARLAYRDEPAGIGGTVKNLRPISSLEYGAMQLRGVFDDVTIGLGFKDPPNAPPRPASFPWVPVAIGGALLLLLRR